MLALSPPLALPLDSTRRWLVSNGTATVGPVPTELLLRGYLRGRIPADCLVRDASWNGWRALWQIRELSAVCVPPDGATPPGPPTLRESARELDAAKCHGTAGELTTLALGLAVRALAATTGLVHRRREPLDRLVTSSVHGASFDQLGCVLPESDPAYRCALAGTSLWGGAESGLAARLVAERLTSTDAVISVIMSPVLVSGKLIAMLELGRCDHDFRANDVEGLADFCAQLARRLKGSVLE
jgi:hypothetical protein